MNHYFENLTVKHNTLATNLKWLCVTEYDLKELLSTVLGLK